MKKKTLKRAVLIGLACSNILNNFAWAAILPKNIHPDETNNTVVVESTSKEETKWKKTYTVYGTKYTVNDSADTIWHDWNYVSEVCGGYSSSLNASVTGNTVTINGGTLDSAKIFGGRSFLGTAGGVSQGEGNTVTLGTVSVAIEEVYGGSGVSAVGNTVKTSGYTGTVSSYVMGGYASAGDATGNSVEITSGTYSGSIFGGYSETVGSVSGNTVTIKGGNFNKDIYGGRALVGSATNNTVAITAVNQSLNGVYGGWAASSSSGNKLSVENKGITVNSVNHFQKYNFTIPSGFNKSSDVMLTINGTTALQFSSSDTISVDLAAVTMAKDDKITLIYTPNTTMSGFGDISLANKTVINGDNTYTYTISLENSDKSLVLTAGVVSLLSVIPTNKTDNTVTVDSPNTASFDGKTQTCTEQTWMNAYGGYSSGSDDVTGNTITFQDTAKVTDNLYGGYSVSGAVQNNTISIKAGTVGGYVYGGYSADGEANSNTVHLISGAVGGTAYGGRGVSAAGNIVNLSGTSISTAISLGSVYGGYATGNTGIADGNTVNITSTHWATVYGGYAFNVATGNSVGISVNYLTGEIYGGSGGNTASGNGVTLFSGTVTGNVYGGYSTSGAVGSQDNGNSVTMKAGRVIGDIYGGYASGSGSVKGNSVTVTGGTVGTTLSKGAVYGGYVAGSGAVESNSITLSDGDFTDAVIYGGYSGAGAVGGTAAAEGNKVTISGTAEIKKVYGGYGVTGAAYNQVIITGVGDAVGTTLSKGVIYGGYTTGATANANNNSVNIGAGNYYANIYGGSADNTANANSVSLSAGTYYDDIYGGLGGYAAYSNGVTVSGGAVSSACVYGGYSSNGTVGAEDKGNSVTITAGSVTGGIYGGYVVSEGDVSYNSVNVQGGSIADSSSLSESLKNGVYGGYSASGTVAHNSVNISGGDLSSNVYGGYAYVGDATNNSVSVTGGSFTGGTVGDVPIMRNIYGGYTLNGDAKNNEVTLSGGDLSDVNIYGGVTLSTDGTSSGNKLSVTGKNIEVNTINAFQSYNFTIPEGYDKSSDVMLKITGITGLSLEDTSDTIAWTLDSTDEVTISGAVGLGDKITLVKTTNGVIDLNYTKKIKISDDLQGVLSLTNYDKTLFLRLVGSGTLKNVVPTSSSENNDENNKAVSITSAWEAYYDGEAKYCTEAVWEYAYGGSSSTSTVENNEITITSADTNSGEVKYSLYGGYSTSGLVQNNKVYIRAGSVGSSVYGGYSYSGLVQSNTVNLYTGTVGGSVYGGYSLYGNVGGEGKGNIVNLGSASINTAVSEGYVYGGYAPGETATAESNEVKVTSGSHWGYVYGGYGAKAAYNNKVTISGGGLSLSAVYGGSSGSGTVGAEGKGNSVTITSSGDVSGAVYGGYASGDGVVSYNKVTLSENGSIVGGVYGGYGSGSGAVSYNNVTVEGGYVANITSQIFPSGIYGGYSGQGTVSYNSVDVSGGRLYSTVYGGYAEKGDATNNSVTVTGGTITGGTITEKLTLKKDVYGGYAKEGNVTNNTVTLSGGSLSDVNVYGGVSASGGTASGNTLSVTGKGITVNSVSDFQNYNFAVPEGFADESDVMLTINDGSVTFVNGGTITVDATNVAEGDIITLISSSDSMEGLDNIADEDRVINNSQGTYMYSITLGADNKQLLLTAGYVSVIPSTPSGNSGAKAVTVTSAKVASFDADGDGDLDSPNCIADAWIHAYGGYSRKDNVAVTGNTITLQNTATLTGNLYGGYSKSGVVQSNKVYLDAGTVGGAVYGGYSDSGNVGLKDARNSVTITSGIVSGVISGGYSVSGAVVGNDVTIQGGNISGNAIYGGYTSGDGLVKSNSVNITGGAIGSGTVIYGGYSEKWTAGGTAEGDGNTVTLSGSGNAKAVYGGYGKYATGNEVTINANYKGTVSGDDDVSVAGGCATDGAVSGNKVQIGGGTYSKAVAGGYTTGSGAVQNNNVTVSGGVISSAIVYGGYSKSGTVGGTSEGVGNTVTLEDSAGSVKAVYGGYGKDVYGNKVTIDEDYTGTVSGDGGVGVLYVSAAGGRATNGTASFNEIEINGGVYSKVVAGGYTPMGGNANNNKVTISDGTFSDISYGGYSVTGGNAKNNEITISGGTFSGAIYGGRAPVGEAIENSVTISGGDLTKADIYGGVGATKSNNTLSIEAEEITVKSVNNFQNYNFTIPSSDFEFRTFAENGDVMLTIAGNTAWSINADDVVSVYGTGLGVGTMVNLVNVTNNVITISDSNAEAKLENDNLRGILCLINDDKTLLMRVVGKNDSWVDVRPVNSTENNTVTVTSPWSASIQNESTQYCTQSVWNDAYGGYSNGNASVTGNSITFTKVGGYGTPQVSGNLYGGYSTSGSVISNEVGLSVGIVGGNVYGGYSGSGAVKSNSVSVTGGTVTSGVVYGGYSNGTVGGMSKDDGNKVTLDGSISLKNIYGGYSESGTVTYNSAEIKNGTVSEAVYGGYTVSGTVNNNVVSASGGDLSGTTIYGGYSENGAAGSKDNGNKVDISGSVKAKNIYGGWGSSAAYSNEVSIYGGIISSACVVGGFSANGVVGTEDSGNTVKISSGSIKGGVYGGYASGSGVVSYNSVSINGGSVENGTLQIFTSGVYGGYSTSGAVEHNSVSISNGTVSSDIYGGYGIGSVKSNSVNISGGVLSSAIIYGGYSLSSTAGGAAEGEGNKVILEGTSGLNIIYGGYGVSAVGNKVVTNGYSGTVAGGAVVSGLAASVVGGRATSGSAENNEVEIAGGTYSSNVFGGYSTNTTDGNVVTVSGGSFNYGVYGGYSISGDATGNGVTFTDGCSAVVADAYGGYALDGNAKENTLTIRNGTFNDKVYAGYSPIHDAYKNILTISGGNFAKEVYGGYAYGDSEKDHASENEVTISGGTFAGNVYAGYTSAGYADKNTLTISGGTFAADIYAGYSKDGTPTDNIIAIIGTDAKYVGGTETAGLMKADKAVDLAGTLTIGAGTTASWLMVTNGISVADEKSGSLAGGSTTIISKLNSVISNAGTLSISNLIVNGDITNTGKLDADEDVAFVGNIDNMSDGTITLADAANITDSGTVTNAGTMNLTAGILDHAVKNNGTLNVKNGTLNGIISGTGTTVIAGIVTNTDGNTVTQSGLTVNAGATFTTKIADLTIKSDASTYSDISNAGTLILTDVTETILNNSLSGSGTLQIGTAEINANISNSNDQSIANNLDIRSGSSFTGSIDNLGGTITNNGTFIASGSLTKDIAGTGKTKIASTMTADDSTTRTIAGTLDLNGGKLNMQGTSAVVNSISVGTLAANGGTIDFDATISTTDSLVKVDTIEAGTAGGTIALGSVNLTSDSASSMESWAVGAVVDNVKFIDAATYNSFEIDKTVTAASDGYMYEFAKGTDNGTLKVVKGYSGSLADIVQNRTVSGYPMGKIATYSLLSDYTQTVEKLGEFKGVETEEAARSLTINGNNHVFSGGNSYSGISVRSGDTLNLTNISDISCWEYYAVKNAGTVNISGNTVLRSKLAGTGKYTLAEGSTLTVAEAEKLAMTEITNNGTVNLGNTEVACTLISVIGGTGETKICGDINSGKTITQSKVTVAAGTTLDMDAALTAAVDNDGTLTIDADNMIGTVANAGILKLETGTLPENSVVTNTGSVVLAGDVSTVGGNLAGAGLYDLNNQTLTISAGDLGVTIGSAEKVAGTLEIAGITTASKNIHTDVKVDAAGKLTVAADAMVAGTIVNEGTLNLNSEYVNATAIDNDGTLNVTADNLKAAVTNTNGTVNLGTGTLEKIITDGTLIVGGAVITSADNLKAKTVTNNGSIALTGGSLTVALAGTLSNSDTLRTDAGNLQAALDNTGAVELTAGTLNNAINGGTTSINGKVTVAANVGNITVAEQGILTAGISNLTGTITNGGTFNMSGDLTKNIAGAGTTVLQSDAAVTAAKVVIDGTLNGNGKSVSLQGDVAETGNYTNLEVGKLTGTVNLNFTADLNEHKNDYLVINGAETAAQVIVNSVKVAVDATTMNPGTITYANDVTNVTYSVKNGEISTTTGYYTYTFTNNPEVGGQLKYTMKEEATTIKDFIEGKMIPTITSFTLVQDTTDGNEGTFKQGPDELYIYVENYKLGTDGSQATIDVAQDKVMNLDGKAGTVYTNWDVDGDLNTSGTIIMEGQVTGDGTLTNEGTLNITADKLDIATTNTNGIINLGAGTLNKAITDGTLNVIAAVTTSADNLKTATVNNTGSIALTGGSLTVALSGSLSNSGELTTDAKYLEAALANTGTVKLTDGTLSQVITDGNINIVGEVTTLGSNLNQNTVVINSGKNLTLTDGTVTVTGTNSFELNGITDITATGKLTIDNAAVVEAFSADIFNVGIVAMGEADATKYNSYASLEEQIHSDEAKTFTEANANIAATGFNTKISNLNFAGGNLHLMDEYYTLDYVDTAKEVLRGVGSTSLVMMGELIQYTPKGEIINQVIVDQIDDDSPEEEVVTYDQVTAATVNGSLLVGSNDVLNTDGAVDEVQKATDVTVRDTSATSLSVNQLNLQQKQDTDIFDGVVITNAKSVTVGGSQQQEGQTTELMVVSDKDGKQIENNTLKVVVGLTADTAEKLDVDKVGTLNIGNENARAENNYSLNGALVINPESKVTVKGQTNLTSTDSEVKGITLNDATLRVESGSKITTNGDLVINNIEKDAETQEKKTSTISGEVKAVNTTVTGATLNMGEEGVVTKIETDIFTLDDSKLNTNTIKVANVEVVANKVTVKSTDKDDQGKNSTLTGKITAGEVVMNKAEGQYAGESVTLNVGNEKGAGIVSAEKTSLDGNMLFLDPVFKDGIIESATNYATETTDLDGAYVVGRNSVLTLGSKENDAITNLFNADDTRSALGKVWSSDGTDGGVTAAVYIVNPVSVVNGSLVVDGSLDAAPASVDNGTVTFAANSLLMVDAQNFLKDSGNVAISGIKEMTVDKDSLLFLEGVESGETYELLLGEVGVLDTDNTWKAEQIKTNAITQAEVRLDGTKYKVYINSKAYEFDGTVAPDVLQAMNLDAATTPAHKYIGAVTSARFATAEQNANMNRLVDMSEQLNVLHGQFVASNLTEEAVNNHLTLNNESADKEIWAQAIRTKEHVDGLGLAVQNSKYTAQYNGAVVGMDLLTKNKNTLGVALTYIDGKTNGLSGNNDSEYYGATLYGRMDMSKDTGLLYDMTFTRGKNDLQLNSGCSYEQITGDQQASSFSVGARLEQKIRTGHSTSFVPHIGARWLRMAGGSFTDSVGMNHDSESTNTLIIPVGLSFKASMHSEGWKMSFLADGGYQWNTADRDVENRVGYDGSKNSFNSTFADGNSWYAGAGFEFNRKNLTAGVSYRYSKSDSTRQNKWNVNLSWSF